MSENQELARATIDFAIQTNVNLKMVDGPLPALTDAECVEIARTTIFSYPWIREVFPQKKDNHKRDQECM